MRRSLMVATMLVVGLVAPASVAGGQPDTVDPGMMQPALNPTFAPWDCWRTGTGYRL